MPSSSAGSLPKGGRGPELIRSQRELCPTGISGCTLCTRVHHFHTGFALHLHRFALVSSWEKFVSGSFARRVVLSCTFVYSKWGPETLTANSCELTRTGKGSKRSHQRRGNFY